MPLIGRLDSPRPVRDSLGHHPLSPSFAVFVDALLKDWHLLPGLESTLPDLALNGYQDVGEEVFRDQASGHFFALGPLEFSAVWCRHAYPTFPTVARNSAIRANKKDHLQFA